MLTNFLEQLNLHIWGWGLLSLLLLTGIFYTIKLDFIQFRLVPFLINALRGSKRKLSKDLGFWQKAGDSTLRLNKKHADVYKNTPPNKNAKSPAGAPRPHRRISQFKTVCASLGTAMGTGNIVGVSTALAIGGAGAVFWMWISAFFGMAIVYAENYLSIHFRHEHGRTGIKEESGPMYYISDGLGLRGLAVIFSVFCILASFGMGGMVQANSISISIREVCGISPVTICAVIFIAVFAVITGGIKRISSASQVLIPILTAVYIIVSVIVIILHRNALPQVIQNIFKEAFNFKSAAGGAISQAISVGIRRGIFSNEAGLGSSPIMHGAVSSENPDTQGMWSIFEVFLDTMVCCTLTALVLLTTRTSGISGAFACVFGGFSGIFTAVSITLFAFCTIIGWYYCSETAFDFISGGKHIMKFRLLFAAAAASGAILTLNSVWTLSDIFNGLMAFPNLAALLLLSRHVGRVRNEDSGFR